jgi:geranylgeranyl pyrophosphate synthase
MLRPATYEPSTLWDVLEPLLERWLSARGGEAGGCRAVPARLWERSIEEPLRNFLRRPGKAFRANLVQLSWNIAGAADEAPIALPLLVELVHAGSLIVDDIQDDSTHRRGAPALHRQHGLPLALNTGSSLYFWPFLLLSEMGLPAERELDLHRRMTRTMLRCHHGQALDLATLIDDVGQEEVAGLAACVAELKTAGLMQLAAGLGAAAAGAEPNVVDALEAFGASLGAGLQMLNDLCDLAGGGDPEKRHEDLRASRITWTWAWLAEGVDPPTFLQYQQSARAIREGRGCAATLARDLLDELGDKPQRSIAAHLRNALDRLTVVLGDRPGLGALADEVARLERSYAS